MAFEHILFPIDFSDHSTRLNCEVEWLASRFGSRVTILHVSEIPASWYGASDAPSFSPECFQAFVESERQRLEEYALDVPEITIRRVIAEGSPAWEIAKCASNYDVDCPVWTDSLLRRTRGVSQPEYASIACALDMSDEAIAVLLSQGR